MSETKPVLLVSDVHLGATSPGHRAAFLEWLDHAATEAGSILINGDLFDFWFEYHWGITRGHDDVLRRLREIVDSGVTRTIAGHRTYLAHGDGLGAGDWGYLALKSVLRSPLTRFAFGCLPASVGDRIAGGVSNTEERWDQWGEGQKARSAALERWALEKLEREPELDLVLLGHTHLPMVRDAGPGRWYVNSGDWVFHQTYVTLEHGAPPSLADWRDRA